MYIGVASNYDDFAATLRSIPNVDETVACLLFNDDTTVDELLAELEYFIKNTVCDLKVILDIAPLFKNEGVDVCLDKLYMVNDYFCNNWNAKHVFAPPIFSRSDMSKFDDVTKIQELINKINNDRGVNPLFSFKWVMVPKKNGLLRHVRSNWVGDSDVLSVRGSISYLKSIFKYLENTIDADFRPDYDLRSRIERHQLHMYTPPVSHRMMGRLGRGQGGPVQAGAQRDPLGIDARMTIARKKVHRELTMVQRLLSMNVQGQDADPARHVREMLQSFQF